MHPEKIYFHRIISKKRLPGSGIRSIQPFFLFHFYFPKDFPALDTIITVDLIIEFQERAHLVSEIHL